MSFIKIFMGVFCLFFGSALFAQQADADKIEHAKLEYWRKSHSAVKLVSQSQLAQCSALERDYFTQTASVLVLSGEELQSSDIDRYTQEKASLASMSLPDFAKQASSYPSGSAAEQQRQELLRLHAPQQYKAQFQSSAPAATQNIKRSEYNAMPARKKAVIDANSQQYSIVD